MVGVGADVEVGAGVKVSVGLVILPAWVETAGAKGDGVIVVVGVAVRAGTVGVGDWVKPGVGCWIPFKGVAVARATFQGAAGFFRPRSYLTFVKASSIRKTTISRAATGLAPKMRRKASAPSAPNLGELLTANDKPPKPKMITRTDIRQPHRARRKKDFIKSLYRGLFTILFPERCDQPEIGVLGGVELVGRADHVASNSASRARVEKVGFKSWLKTRLGVIC
jgi:hypothetical protein